MHRTLKYIYLQRNVNQLHKAVHAIMRFIRDKMVDGLTITHKEKIANKIRGM